MPSAKFRLDVIVSNRKTANFLIARFAFERKGACRDRDRRVTNVITGISEFTRIIERRFKEEEV